jgi:hypothetical protein
MLATITPAPAALAEPIARGEPTKEYYLLRARECRRLAVVSKTDARALFQVLEKRWLALARNSPIAVRNG